VIGHGVLYLCGLRAYGGEDFIDMVNAADNVRPFIEP
jgi:hypothetical protein